MIYFNDIMRILQTQKWEGKSEAIEIAKGKYEIPTTYVGVFKQFKRGMKWLLKR